MNLGIFTLNRSLLLEMKGCFADMGNLFLKLEKENDFKTIVIKDNKIVYKENSVEVYYH